MKIQHRRDKKTIALRSTCTMSEIPEFLGRAYQQVYAYMKQKRLLPAGPPFAIYYNFDENSMDIEAGFPVFRSVAGEGEVQQGILPGGTYLKERHKGPYEELKRTYDAMTAFIEARNLKASGLTFERYLNDPGKRKLEKLKTDVYFKLME